MKRLDSLAVSVAEIRRAMPQLLTKADLNLFETRINFLGIRMTAMEARLIKWMIGTLLFGLALLYAAAKFVH